MTLRRHTALALATVAAGFLALAVFGQATPSASAQTASASDCGDVSVTPSSKTVRRGGRVMLSGKACGTGYASSSSAGDSVQIKLRKGRNWKTVARASADATGEFEACVQVRVPSRTKVARLQVSSASASRTVKVRVSKKGSKSCDSGESQAPAPSKGAGTSGGAGGTAAGGSSSGGSATETPPPPPPPPPSGSLLRHDPGTNPDPMPLWNAIDAQSSSRHQHLSSGGPSGGAYRRLSVQDGDNFWGERAELGYNSRLNGLGAPWGTFFLYQEGQRRVTEFWMRLPTSFPVNTNKWQVVMQMKQTGPSSNSGGTPVLALEAREGNWVLTQSDSPGPSSNTHEVWSTPATLGQWTKVSLDVTYSPDPSQGKVQLSVDGVESPTYTTYTQKYETSPPAQGLTVGGAIPSHLRMGIYHDSSLPGTHVDFADVRVSA